MCTGFPRAFFGYTKWCFWQKATALSKNCTGKGGGNGWVWVLDGLQETQLTHGETFDDKQGEHTKSGQYIAIGVPEQQEKKEWEDQ